jgi:uncharacterized protein YdhG (YjbR/CyaY superfamily)
MTPAGGDGRHAMPAAFATVDDYIASFPPDTQGVLRRVRRTLHDAMPRATESISYAIPTLSIDGRAVVYFAGWKRHVSIYPIPTGDVSFEAQLARYRSGASTARFRLDRPVPWELVSRIATLLLPTPR